MPKSEQAGRLDAYALKLQLNIAVAEQL